MFSIYMLIVAFEILDYKKMKAISTISFTSWRKL